MKIGTDGVLLGAWATLNPSCRSILDIGAGTGLLALMMAQRSTAEWIDALEIDDRAYEQCVDNFENSPWNDRLFCYHADFQDFVEEMNGETYDFIISNPPYFEPPQKQEGLSVERQTARFTGKLSFEKLLAGVAALLSPAGSFALILPAQREDDFIRQAAHHQLFIQKITRVKGHPKAAFKRSLLQFGFNKVAPQSDELVIERARHEYTAAYRALTRDFYL